MGYIYKITNTVNNKAYIGISVNEPEKERIKRHLSGQGNRIIAMSIKKYGIDAFAYEILEENVFDELLPEFERAYIAKFNTVSPHGYNLTWGGEVTKKLSPETRRKLSISHKGQNPWNKGKKMPPGYGFRNSEVHKGNTYRKGKTHSTETRRKISKAHTGKKHSDEHRQKISEAYAKRTGLSEAQKRHFERSRGRKHTSESIEKMRENRRGKHFVPFRDYFLSLPNDMPLAKKRKLMRQKYEGIIVHSTICRYIKRILI